MQRTEAIKKMTKYTYFYFFFDQIHLNKEPTEHLEVKNTITKTKNSMDHFNSTQMKLKLMN